MHKAGLELMNMYIIALPLALMIQFTHDAITHNGIWTIDMTRYGEYQAEVFLLISWFIIAGIRTILRYRVQATIEGKPTR